MKKNTKNNNMIFQQQQQILIRTRNSTLIRIIVVLITFTSCCYHDVMGFIIVTTKTNSRSNKKPITLLSILGKKSITTTQQRKVSSSTQSSISLLSSSWTTTVDTSRTIINSRRRTRRSYFYYNNKFSRCHGSYNIFSIPLSSYSCLYSSTSSSSSSSSSEETEYSNNNNQGTFTPNRNVSSVGENNILLVSKKKKRHQNQIKKFATSTTNTTTNKTTSKTKSISTSPFVPNNILLDSNNNNNISQMNTNSTNNIDRLNIKNSESNNNQKQVRKEHQGQQQKPQQQYQNKVSRIAVVAVAGTTRREQIQMKINALKEQLSIKILDDNNTTNNITTMKQQHICDDLFAECVAYDEWELILVIIDIMKLYNIQQGYSTYHKCLQYCYNVSNAASSKEILLTIEQQQQNNNNSSNGNSNVVIPTSDDITYTILTMCRNDQINKKERKSNEKWYQEAYQLIIKYTITNINNNITIPFIAYDAVIECLAYENQWQDSVRLLRQRESLKQQSLISVEDDDSEKLLLLLSHPENNNRTKLALLQNELNQLSITYRLVIECCIRCYQVDVAVQVLQSCIQNKIIPTTYTFELVILSLSKRLQWRRSLQLLNVMEQYNVTTNIQIYNSILTSCAKAKEISPAKNLLNQMIRNMNHQVIGIHNKDKNHSGTNSRNIVKPNIISYNSVIAACASIGEWKDALYALDLAYRQPGVTPDIYTYTSVIRACAKGGQTTRALTLFQVVKDKKLPLDPYCYTAAIEACSKGGLWQKAILFLNEMEEKGIKASEVTFNVVITACGNGGQWKKALELLSLMRERKMPINLYVYNAAITALLKAAKKTSYNNPSGSNSSSSSSSIEVDNKPLLYKEVMKLLDQMKLDGIEPDGFTFSSAISCCGSEGRWEEALKLIEIMRQGGPKMQPNKIAYTAAITSCGKSGQVDYAIQLFRQMKQQGLYADCVAYNSLFTALRISKRSNDAFELWDEMLGRNQNINTTTTTLKQRATIGSYRSTDPDIITVTDAIAAMSSETNSNEVRQRIDKVFDEAVRRNLVLRDMNRFETKNEIDLSGMALPVARAACRYILRRSLSNTVVPGMHNSSNNNTIHQIIDSDLYFITGVGTSHDDGSSSLRDYVQEILVTDFNPPIHSFVPQQERDRVCIESKELVSWMEKQTLIFLK